MSQAPTPYTRQKNFVSDATSNPNITVAQIATGLDAEYIALQNSVNQTISRLSEIQRSDGSVLNPQTVTIDSLNDQVKQFITSLKGVFKGSWADGTSYSYSDIVTNNSVIYYCLVAHTSSSDIATDLSAGKWFIISFTQIPANMLGDGSITTAKIANSAITSQKIADATIVPADLSVGSPSWDSSGNLSVAGTISSAGNITAPAFNGALNGNSSTTTKLATARTIQVSGAVSGSASFDGSGSVNIATTQSTQVGFRNRLTNGSFRVDQRTTAIAGKAFSNTLVSYFADRWYAGSTNGTTSSIIRTANSNNGLTITPVSSTACRVAIGQRIEAVNIYDLPGNNATLSFYCSGAGCTIDWAVYYPNSTNTYGTVINASNRTVISNGTFTIGSSGSVFNTSFAVPVNATTGIEVVLTVGITSGSAQAVMLNNVQLEAGSVATPFEVIPYDEELRKCQRYYEKSFPQAVTPAQNAGFSGSFQFAQCVAAGVSISSIYIPFKCTKYATPTVTLYNPQAANALIRNKSVSLDFSATTVFNDGADNGIMISGTAPSGVAAAGNQCIIHWVAESEL